MSFAGLLAVAGFTFQIPILPTPDHRDNMPKLGVTATIRAREQPDGPVVNWH